MHRLFCYIFDCDQTLSKNWVETTSSQIIWTLMPLSVNSRMTFTSFWPAFVAFCVVISLLSPSFSTVVVHCLPSVVVSSNGTPYKNTFSNILQIM